MSGLRALYDNYLAASSRSTVETAPAPNPVVEGMDSARFFKLCKDGHLFNRSFRTNDVDIVFANYRINGTEYKKLFCANESEVVVNERKLKGQRRMDYKGFKAALSNVASRRGEDFESMARKLIDTTAGAPSISGTEALPNRFHDDERTFTGVYKQGGPTMVDREKMTMEQLTDRFKKATVRGTPLHVALGPGIHQHINQANSSSSQHQLDSASSYLDDTTQQRGNGGTTSRRGSLNMGLDDKSDGVLKTNPIPADKVEPLRVVFETYQLASTRSADLSSVNLPPPPVPVVDGLDSARFFKLCKDAKLFNQSFRTNDVDIIFTKNKIKGQRKMAWRGFKEAIVSVALKRGDSVDKTISRVLEMTANGPSVNGTEALPNRFHDDERTFTGVYKQGGPTMVDREKMTMEQLTDRFKKATVRGTPLHVALGPGIHQQFYHQDGDNNNDLGSFGGSGADHHFMPPAAPAYGSDQQVNHVKPLKENTIVSARSLADDNIRDEAKVAMRGVFEEYSKMSRGFSSSASKASTTPGGPEDGVDSSRLLKLCNDAMLFGKLFRTNDVDIIFTRNKREGGRKLAFDGFMHALYEVSIKKNVTFMELLDQVSFATTSAAAASSSSSFVASASKLNQSSDFYSSTTPATPLAADVSSQDLEVSPEHEGELQRVFEEYALLSRSIKDRAGAVGSSGGLTADDGIDSSRFLKLCSDCELFDVMFRLQDIDIVFTKCKAAGARKLSLDNFVAALGEICKKKRTSMHALLDKVSFATSGGSPMM